MKPKDALIVALNAFISHQCDGCEDLPEDTGNIAGAFPACNYQDCIYYNALRVAHFALNKPKKRKEGKS